MVIGNQFIPADKAVERKMLGHDFTAFYSAGHFAAAGDFDKLYDVRAIKDFEQETGRQFGLSLGDSYGPYWNPPFYAWVFAPLSKLAYPNALLVWTLFNVACGLAALALLTRMLAPPGVSQAEAGIAWKQWGLVPLLVIVSMPVLQALSHGQNTMTSLLLLSATVTFWRNGSGVRAGLVAGLLFYKPQLGAIVAAALVATMGWRALAGLATTGTALLLITLKTMPGMLWIFFSRLPKNLRFMQIDHAYVWERHATFKAFWRLLIQGRSAGEAFAVVSVLTGLCVIALATALVVAVKREAKISNFKFQVSNFKFEIPNRKSQITNRKSQVSDALISAAIASMPLLMPFYFDYDLMLLAIPAVLFAGEMLRQSSSIEAILADGVLAVPKRYGWASIPSAKADPSSSSHAQSSVLNPRSYASSDRWLIRGWVALYAWTLVNPGIAGSTRVNLTVPLLAAVASMLVARAIRLHPPVLNTGRFKRESLVADNRGRQPRIRLTGAGA